jgi:phage terminase large subunit-like protein
MTEANTEKPIFGYSKPRLQSPSLKLPSAGQVVADLAIDLGVPLLPHQKYLMDEALVIKNGKWARSTVGAIMARQNGKSHALRMRILAGLYIFGEKNIIAISQSRMLSLDTFRQVVDMAEGTDWTRKRIKRVSRTNGQEELEIYCQHYPKACGEKCDRIRKYAIKAANSESPRGSTADLLWIDELREINTATWQAATPLTRARPNAQTWVTSNAGDDSSTVLNELRQRALTFQSDRLGWYEWSAATDDINDIENWKMANPALGHTIQLENLEDSAKFDNPDAFRTESLSIWINAIDSPFPLDIWNAGEAAVQMEDDLPTFMAMDLSFNRDKAYLVTVQQRADEKLACFVHEWTGLSNIELASEIATLARRFKPRVLAYDPNTAGFLAPQLARTGIAVAPTPWSSTAFSIFCDQTLAAMSGGQLLHPNQEILRTHLGASARKPASDGGWRIARRASTNPISSAVALVMAVGHATQPQANSAIFVV